MNTRIAIFSLTLVSALGTQSAFAATTSVNPLSVGGILCGLVGILAGVFSWLRSAKHKVQASDLAERLAQSERTVRQLQSIRGENQRTIEQKNSALAEVQLQRTQSQEMLQSLRQQVERVARIDGLTGVANRQQFAATLDDEVKRTVRQRKPLSLLFAEIDFFGDYGDINGTEKTDHSLQKVASSISETFRRAGDLVARIDDSKFAVILPEADNTTSQKFAEKLRRHVYDLCVPFPGSDVADRITVSVGVVTVPPTRLHERDYIVAMADNALLHAQSSGHNRISQSAHAA